MTHPRWVCLDWEKKHQQKIKALPKAWVFPRFLQQQKAVAEGWINFLASPLC
jgi:hypothetical protein